MAKKVVATLKKADGKDILFCWFSEQEKNDFQRQTGIYFNTPEKMHYNNTKFN